MKGLCEFNRKLWFGSFPFHFGLYLLIGTLALLMLGAVLSYYNLWEKHKILYGGLVELIVNAMTDVKPGFIEWEWR